LIEQTLIQLVRFSDHFGSTKLPSDYDQFNLQID